MQMSEGKLAQEGRKTYTNVFMGEYLIRGISITREQLVDEFRKVRDDKECTLGKVW